MPPPLAKATMKQTTTSSFGGEVVCPKCGARYEVKLWPRPKEEEDYASCQKCRSVMLEWVDSVARSFKFIDRV
jgi:DNA-directed RNA polymerase subunit RPC12/RpoP